MMQLPLGVQSYPELYLTLIGWNIYGDLWKIIIETGIVYLPFVAILLRNFSIGFTSPFIESASRIVQRRIEYDFVAAILVIMLAGQPMIRINPDHITYTPHCDESGEVYRPGSTGTTYDDYFPQVVHAHVPAWWYTVLGISQALTSVSIRQLECKPDIRAFNHELDLTQLDDQQLRREVQLFNGQCFGRARAKFYREEPNFDSYITLYGYSDLDWIGSKAYLRVPGYYDTFYAPKPTEGFVFDPAQDWRDGQLDDDKPEWGRPSCRDWWLDKQHGLQERIFNELSGTAQRFFYNISTLDKDQVVKKLVRESTMSDQLGGGRSFLLNVGLRWEQLKFWPKVYALKSVTPIIQATLIFLVTVMLPWALIFTAYKPATLVRLAFIIFSLKYFSFLWALVDYLDQVMLRALYPEILRFIPSVEHGIAEMMIATLYIGAPALWLMLFSWLGQIAGIGLLGAIGGMATPAYATGAASTAAVTTVASGVVGATVSRIADKNKNGQK